MRKFQCLTERMANSLYYRNIYRPIIFLLYIILIALILACKYGYRGTNCKTKCPFPLYGEDCQLTCDCVEKDCDHAFGCKGISIKNAVLLICIVLHCILVSFSFSFYIKIHLNSSGKMIFKFTYITSNSSVSCDTYL